MLKKLSHLITLLGLNSIPALGWFVGGWSAGTTLGLFWVENVAASLLVAARIWMHSRVNPCRGHFQYKARQGNQAGGSFAGGFLTVSLMFSAAHGIFLAVIFFILTHNGHGKEVDFSWVDFQKGSLSMAGFLVLGFLIDLPGLRKKPFSWSEAMGDRMLSRVIVVHLTLIFGIGAVAFTNATRAFFAVFVVLKTLCDLSMILPQWDPAVPPKWLSWAMNKVPNVHPGQKFEDFWVKDKQAEVDRREVNERPWKAEKAEKA